METAEQTQIRERDPITNPHDLFLFEHPQGTLRLTVADNYSFLVVRLYQAAPLSQPKHFLAFQDGKGEEIALVPHLSDLTTEAQPVAEAELARRYLTAKIESVSGVKTEFGATYWNVVTSRGERDFVMQSLTESCIWLSDTHILLIDVDGNRFEIPDRTLLDAASRERLASVL